MRIKIEQDFADLGRSNVLLKKGPRNKMVIRAPNNFLTSLTMMKRRKQWIMVAIAILIVSHTLPERWRFEHSLFRAKFSVPLTMTLPWVTSVNSNKTCGPIRVRISGCWLYWKVISDLFCESYVNKEVFMNMLVNIWTNWAPTDSVEIIFHRVGITKDGLSRSRKEISCCRNDIRCCRITTRNLNCNKKGCQLKKREKFLHCWNTTKNNTCYEKLFLVIFIYVRYRSSLCIHCHCLKDEIIWYFI